MFNPYRQLDNQERQRWGARPIDAVQSGLRTHRLLLYRLIQPWVEDE